jgi:glycosyltransferase involved in cell wall biosynthesis
MHSKKDDAGGMPLVSVITPAYNRADYLEETIESVLSQDYPNLEYIVLDDGSKDNTRELLAKYDGRIRWESHENMGETRTVNKGFGMASGEIIGVVNSDDPLYPGAITQIVNKIMSDPRLLVVYPDWDLVDKDGNVVEHITTQDYSYINTLRNFHCVPGPGAFFRRRVVEMLGGRDAGFRYVADFDFWLRAGMYGPFARIPKTLATFRVHPGSATVSQKGSLMAEEHVALLRKTYSHPGLPAEAMRFAIRREACSSAYFIAGITCGDELKFKRAWYYVLSLYYAPWSYLDDRSWRMQVVLAAVLGRFYKPFEPVFKAVYRLLKFTRSSARKILSPRVTRSQSPEGE